MVLFSPTPHKNAGPISSYLTHFPEKLEFKLFGNLPVSFKLAIKFKLPE